MDNITQYLNEIKAELQELYENLDHELLQTDNKDLIDDGYHNVTSKLESALNEMESLINDIDAGVYDSAYDSDDADAGTSEVEEY